MDLTLEMQVEPNVSRDEIRRIAHEAAELNRPLHDANPYPIGTRARMQFERDFWDRDRQLNDEETT